MTLSSREAAFLAVFQYLKAGTYADVTLAQLHTSDAAARQIAYGTLQRLISLDYLAKQLASRQNLKLKQKERALLATALYQVHYMTDSPLYAVTNEMVQLAKKHCHVAFARFLNALLRSYAAQAPTLPTDDSVSALSIRYSYPEWLIERLLQDYGLTPTLTILDLGNRPAPTMARLRSSPFKMVEVANPSEVAASTELYIQNATPVKLIKHLATTQLQPRRILDLCAAPGGKLLLAHDLYPNAQLFANDVSSRRLETLQENLRKYGVQAEVRCGPAESYPTDQPFDLIILDVPCSNTGVLGKRPEARWRLSEEFLKELEVTQFELLKSAVQLLAPNGTIWYLTCSILKRENEQLIDTACQRFKLASQTQLTLLPAPNGADGGFAAALLS